MKFRREISSLGGPGSISHWATRLKKSLLREALKAIKVWSKISKLSTKKERKNELIELIGGGFSEANDYASRLLERAAA